MFAFDAQDGIPNGDLAARFMGRLCRLAPWEGLADAVADRVVRRIGPSGAHADVYTSNASGPGIPGKSHRWMLRHMPTMPGSYQVKRDWQITRTHYEAWLRAEDTGAARRATLAKGRPALDDDATADEALRAAGRRPNQRTTR